MVKFYAVFFFVIMGDPVIIKDDEYHSSFEACQQYSLEQLRPAVPRIFGYVESNIGFLCVKKDFSTITDG